MINLALQPRKTGTLTVFLHIPKTAGSTVNDCLEVGLGPGTRRIIRILDQRKIMAWITARADWVSGHVHLPRLDATLTSVTDRPLRYVTVLRDPVAQLASHYNWCAEIHRRGRLTYYRYSKRDRDISHEIRHANNADPDAVIDILRRHQTHFLNHQSRFLLGRGRLGLEDLDEVRAALGRFEYVGRADQLGAFYEALGIQVDTSTRSNTSPYDFDPAIFQTDRVQKFLRRRHALDFELWDMIRKS